MANNRKFYKTTFTVEVLSEEPIPEMSLDALEDEYNHGSYSAGSVKRKEKELTVKQVTKELKKQGSDPSFFMIEEKK